MDMPEKPKSGCNELYCKVFELKKLKQKFLKSYPSAEQSNIIKKIDSIGAKMETNQRQATKVKNSRLKDMKKNRKK